MSGAVEVGRTDAPRYFRLVENLCIATGTPMPKLYVVDDPAPNAFATGRKPEEASITVTTGLFELMTDRELDGVLGHELGHIRNYDIRVSLLVFGLVVAVGILADMFLRVAFYGRRGGNSQSQVFFLIFGVVAAIVAPLLAGAVQAAISRQREYLADATSAMTTRDPDGLASALDEAAGERAAAAARRTPRWRTCGSPIRSSRTRSPACSRPTRRSRSGSSASARWAARSRCCGSRRRRRGGSRSARSCSMRGGRPGVVETVDDLVAVALDPTAAIAPSADLILWSRIGWPYQPADLVRAMEEDRVVFEWGGFCRPMSDLALFVPLMRAGLPYAGRPGLARGQRPLPPRCARAAGRARTAASGRDPRHGAGVLALERLDAQPQLVADARDAAQDRRGRGRGARREGPAVRPRRADLPAGHPGARGRGGRGAPRGAPAVLARHRPGEGGRAAERADRRRHGRPHGGRGRRGRRVAGGPGIRLARRRLPAAHGAAVAPGPARLRPRSPRASCSATSTCSRCTSRPRSAAGATSRCRSCTAIGWSASSTRRPIARAGCCACTRCTRTSPGNRMPRPPSRTRSESLAEWLGLAVQGLAED